MLKILNFNSNHASADGAGLYKILVLDRFTKDVIAPLLRVSDLRKQGVTLHLVIESERQPIADVPAIYLVQPTQANLERIALDATNGLYDTMHLNFTSTLPTRLMEQLATAAVKSGSVNRIGKLFDQYLSFIALEPTLFSLGLPDAYVQLNDPTASDGQIEVTSCVRGRMHALGASRCMSPRPWRCPCMGGPHGMHGSLGHDRSHIPYQTGLTCHSGYVITWWGRPTPSGSPACVRG